MLKVSDIYEALEGFAPGFLKLDGDNVGLLVGDPSRTVTRAVFTLDITPAVARFAAEQRAELVISHHPIIHSPLYSVTSGDYYGASVMTLLENKIAAICMHTNLDAAAGGVNDVLADRLMLSDVRLAEDGGQGLLRIGRLPAEMSPEDFARHTAQRLGCGGVRAVMGKRPVKTVAVCGGAGGGSEDAMHAYLSGCDAYVTAELKYHTSLEMDFLGLTVVDAGHFYTENPVIDALEALAEAKFPQLERLRSPHRDPARLITL